MPPCPRPLLPAILGAALVLAVLPARAAPAPDGRRTQVRIPAEFERTDALLVGAAQMVQFHPQVLVDIVKAVHRNIEVVGLVGFQAEGARVDSLLSDAGLPADAVTMVTAPVRSMWARDYGPLTAVDPQGNPYFLDATYEGRGAVLDDEVPDHLGARLQVPVIDLPLTMEGGDLLSNGRGLVLVTQRLFRRNEADRDYSHEDTWGILQLYGGFTDFVALPSLQGEPTGHLDMYLTFVGPTTVVVGSYDPAVDPDNAAWLDWIARQLAGRATAGGTLRVERIPMPPHDDGVWRTYTNVVYANGVLLVPTYPERCPELDRQAVAFYEELLPGWKVVGVAATSLIRRNGSLHCVTLGLSEVPARL